MRLARAQRRRGQALVMTLGLVLIMTLLVTGTLMSIAAQLRVTNTERDYERALLAAEAGANAYLNRLANGASGQSISELSLADFRQSVLSRRISLTRYPTGSQQGYHVGHVGLAGGTVSVLSYGWSNGVVRRVRLQGKAFSVFDTAAVFALNPSVTASGDPDSSTGNYSWRVSGNASIIGACGSDGRIDYSANNRFYDGPFILGGPTARFSAGVPPPLLQSAPGIPPGHVGTGTVANPAVRRYGQRSTIPTVDQSANRHSGSTEGTEYFRTRNNNATGLRYLVRNKTMGTLRELNDPARPYAVMAAGDFALDGEFNPSPTTLSTLGMTAAEEFFGIRAYPGHYFFDQINMQSADRLYLRTFTDAERASIGRAADPPNPNTGQSENANVRIWIGRRSSGGDPNTSFSYQTVMEYAQHASRFRVYVASMGTVNIGGLNQNPPPPFRVNLLAYNRLPNGTPYGSVSLSSSTYVYGALIGWQVSVGGGSTLEAQVSELTGEDRLFYAVTDWTELP